MTNPLQQLEQKLQTHQKRIADLEVKYAQLLEELKMLRAEVAKRAEPPTVVQSAVGAGYESRFERWPGAQR